MSVRGYAMDWHGRCPYCGVVLTDYVRTKPATLGCRTQRGKDHIVPQHVGGSVYDVDGGSNLVWACMQCNRDKHHLTLTEWRIVRMMRGQGPFMAWDSDLPHVVYRWLRTYWLTNLTPHFRALAGF